MIGQYLITFREVLEAALITAIIIAYFKRTNKDHLIKYVWLGISLALVASVGIAMIISLIYGGLSSADAKLFEGIASIIAVIVLTGMIFWMSMKGNTIKKEIDQKISQRMTNGTIIGLVAFSFIVVFREGFETVLFLIPFGASDTNATIIGASLGLFSALFVSYLIYSVGLKLNIRRYFYFSSILLVLLAAGLLGYGIHELISYQKAIGTDVGWLGIYAFDLGISDGSFLHHKGAIGSIFAVMLGYSVKMEYARIIVHISYLIIFLPLTIITYRAPHYIDRLAILGRRIWFFLRPQEKIQTIKK